MYRSFYLLISAGLILLSMGGRLALAESTSSQTVWTLESSVRHALSQAPEIDAASAEIAAREARVDQAGAWPNPILELRADQKLGLDDGRGGADVTQIALNQALPWRRLASQRRQAEEELEAARERRRATVAAREAEAARAFHILQLAQTRMDLAQQRVAFVAALDPAKARSRDRVVRFQTPLERARLAILHEAAEQEVAFAEGKYSEALSMFRTLLGLPVDIEARTAPLIPSARPPALDDLLRNLDRHPNLAAADQDIEAARAAIDVERASRLADPVVGVFRERDFLGGARRGYSGITLGIQIPLWHSNSAGVARATAELTRVQAARRVQRRDLEAQLRQSWVHAGHLLDQSERYRERLLAPARRMLELARRGFQTGEQSLLALLDAYNIYFDAELRYYELLQESWMEAVALRAAAGVLLTQGEGAP